MRTIRDRPTAMERWPNGWREGMRLASGPQDRAGDGFYQKRLPKGAPDFIETARITFPSGRTADELCPTEPASLVWAAQMGVLTFHPRPVRRPDVDQPDELRIDLDPHPGTSFSDAQRVAEVAGKLLEELVCGAIPRRAAIAASTSMCAFSQGGPSTKCGTQPSVSAASWSAATAESPPLGGKKSAAPGCSWTTTRTCGIGPSPAHGVCVHDLVPR